MRSFFCLLLLLLSVHVFAQSNAKLTGRVVDSASGKPVEYATITVLEQSTHNVINGAIADAKGFFEVTGLPAGMYTVSVEFLSYKKRTIDNVSVGSKDNLVLKTILLIPSGNVLKEVTVTGSAPIIENKIDKLVYNAANDITSQGGLAIDVLRKVPQVNVDIDGNVELQGNSNIRFLINGKPSSIFGSSLIDALSAIPASQIKSIEVITSPGAKYDAQGTGGIINIVLKENKMQGINGNINLSGGSLLQNGSANLNIRHNKFGFNAHIGGNGQFPVRTPSSQDRTSFDSSGNAIEHLVQNGYTDFKRKSVYGGAGFDWSPSKYDNITGSANYYYYGYGNEGVTQLQQSAPPDSPSVNSTRISNSTYHNYTVDLNLDYKKTFKKENQELEIICSSSFGEPVNAYNQSLAFLNAATPYSGATGSNLGSNKETNISVDYIHPVTKDLSLETGVKTVLQTITSNAGVNTYRPDSNEYILDPGQSYDLDYNRQIYAAYFSTSFSLFHYLKVKAGARYEHTDTKIGFPNTTVPAYNTVVPSVILSHDINKSAFIKLAYTRRLERPDYRDINPFLNLADPYNITTGNPTLKPEIGNRMEFGFNKNFGKSGNLYIAVIENINTQDHKNFTRFYQSYTSGDSVYTNVTITRVENTGTEYNSGISVSGSWTIKDKLSLRGNVSAYHRYLVTGTASGDVNAGVRGRANLNVSYQFPKDLIAEAFGNYNSASGNIQGRSPQSITYTVAFRKQFWNKNASIGLTATNLFNRYIRQVTTIATPTYTSYSVRELPYRSVGISFTYKFGKLEFKKGKEDDFINEPPAPGN